MSLAASVVIVFVLLLRLLLKKVPKVISYALWAIVLVRLLCPVSIESGFSLFGLLDNSVAGNGTFTGRIEYVPNNIAHTEYPNIVLPVPGVNDAIPDASPQEKEQLRTDPSKAPIAIATYIWMTGVLAMVIYAAVSYIRLRRKLITASPLRDNIYLADEITSPFVMGLFRPKIYLPSSMEEQEQSYILMHEQHHIRRFDHIIKALAFVALSIHWFNPLVWIAFIMAGKDMEMSCDEAVIRKMGDGILANYAASLLNLATGRRVMAGVPPAFGEGDTKGRIRNLANRKKPALWVIAVAVIVCVALAVCLLTNPKTQRLPFDLKTIKISWAKALDYRPNEPTSYDLNDAELDELKARLADLKIGRKDKELGGFTPVYSISI
jgi:beta-lactamase regulating signal transducer with metallopeptidase domain